MRQRKSPGVGRSPCRLPFIAVFALYVALSFVFPAESKLPRTPIDATLYIVENFLLLPGLFPIEPIITVAWSLSYEMFYYLVIPVLIGLLSLRVRSGKWRILFFATMAVAVVICCTFLGGPVRLIMFLSGILLYEVMHNKLLAAPPGSVALLVLLIGLLSLVLISGTSGGAVKISILFGTFFILCFTCFCRPNDWLAKAFSSTPVRWLGNMSYSYYLLHGLALKAGFLVLGVFIATNDQGVLFFFALLPLMFGVTLVPSAALFLTVERPFSLAPSRTRCAPLEPRHGAAKSTIKTDAPLTARRLP